MPYLSQSSAWLEKTLSCSRQTQVTHRYTSKRLVNTGLHGLV